MQKLLTEIRSCTFCEPDLDLGANPIISVSKNTKIVLISQAPGRIAHLKNKPWDDPSGKILRKWLNVDEETFYNTENFGVFPMAFCYPGKGKTGDKPPKKECAILWHDKVLQHLKNVKLKILIGQYSQKYYLNSSKKETLTTTVKNATMHLPEYFPIPHPSPRNRFWLQKNEWFEKETVPILQEKVATILKAD
ncbi:uracil-DNA glycosylase family protein [Polaribacter sp.]|nr:uracil-DNA glycosylase family protein [Polaribacter sp.]